MSPILISFFFICGILLILLMAGRGRVQGRGKKQSHKQASSSQVFVQTAFQAVHQKEESSSSSFSASHFWWCICILHGRNAHYRDWHTITYIFIYPGALTSRLTLAQLHMHFLRTVRQRYGFAGCVLWTSRDVYERNRCKYIDNASAKCL